MDRAAPPTLVLDTNAWLDLLVFHDPALRDVAAAVERGALRIAIDARAFDELARVLAYPGLRLGPADAARHLDAARRLCTLIDVPPLALPRCRDPDDQPFLEIAVASRATWLLTRDAELLCMAARMMRDHGVAILSPARWGTARGDQMSKR